MSIFAAFFNPQKQGTMVRKRKTLCTWTYSGMMHWYYGITNRSAEGSDLMRATNFEELWNIEHTDANGKRIKYKPKRQHREDAEWLTLEICNEYMKKAAEIGTSGAVGSKRDLRIELQNHCVVTEVEAVNILNGSHIKEYVHNYDIMRGKSEGGYTGMDMEPLSIT